MYKVSALSTYVDHKNAFASLFNSKATQLSLQNAKDRQKIADSISSELSPENLTCDGELRGAAVMARKKALVKVARELQKLDPNVTFYETV